MTIKEWSQKYLTDRGLWPREAKAVIEEIGKAKEFEALSAIYNKQTQGYPDAVLATVAVTMSSGALKYIDENAPQHFARPMFA